MRAAKMADRTISDCQLHVNSFIDATYFAYIDEIDAASIYVWLASTPVNKTRCGCFKAFLGKCASTTARLSADFGVQSPSRRRTKMWHNG